LYGYVGNKNALQMQGVFEVLLDQFLPVNLEDIVERERTVRRKKRSPHINNRNLEDIVENEYALLVDKESEGVSWTTMWKARDIV
jgi:hypothetical protein